MALTLLLVLGSPVLYMRLQQAIPDYQWDVRDNCRPYWQALSAQMSG